VRNFFIGEPTFKSSGNAACHPLCPFPFTTPQTRLNLTYVPQYGQPTEIHYFSAANSYCNVPVHGIDSVSGKGTQDHTLGISVLSINVAKQI
jgi:hypothetical protein